MEEKDMKIVFKTQKKYRPGGGNSARTECEIGYCYCLQPPWRRKRFVSKFHVNCPVSYKRTRNPINIGAVHAAWRDITSISVITLLSQICRERTSPRWKTRRPTLVRWQAKSVANVRTLKAALSW